MRTTEKKPFQTSEPAATNGPPAPPSKAAAAAPAPVFHAAGGTVTLPWVEVRGGVAIAGKPLVGEVDLTRDPLDVWAQLHELVDLLRARLEEANGGK